MDYNTPVMLGRRAFPLAICWCLSIDVGSVRADAPRPRVCVVDLHDRGWVSIDDLTSALRASMNDGEVELVFVGARGRPSGGDDARAAWARRISIENRGDAVLWVEPARRRFEATLWLLDATGSEPRLHALSVPGETAFDAHRTLALTARSLLRDALRTGPPETPERVVEDRTVAVARAARVITPRAPPATTPLLGAMGPVARQNGETVLGWRIAAGVRLPGDFALYAGADLLRDETPAADLRRTRVPIWLALSRSIVDGGIGLRAEVRASLTTANATVGNAETATESRPYALGAGATVVGRARLASGMTLEIPVGIDARLASFGDAGEAERTAPGVEGSFGLLLALGDN